MTTDARFDELHDLEEVRRQIVRFSRYTDERRWDDYAALFTPDGVLELPFGSWTGRETIAAHVAQDLGRYVATHHHNAGQDIVLDGDTARARATFIATHVTSPDGLAFWQGGGAYHLDLRRVDGAWRIAHLRVAPTWRQATGMALPAH